jgi:hypothetical protein
MIAERAFEAWRDIAQRGLSAPLPKPTMTSYTVLYIKSRFGRVFHGLKHANRP